MMDASRKPNPVESDNKDKVGDDNSEDNPLKEGGDVEYENRR